MSGRTDGRLGRTDRRLGQANHRLRHDLFPVLLLLWLASPAWLSLPARSQTGPGFQTLGFSPYDLVVALDWLGGATPPGGGTPPGDPGSPVGDGTPPGLLAVSTGTRVLLFQP